MNGSNRFSNKAALVTGAACGQGEEHVWQLVAQGARVIFTDILEDQGRDMAAESGDAALFLVHDVADAEGWVRVMAAAQDFAGGLDYPVNNAAVARFGPLADTDVAAFVLHQQRA